MRSSRSKVGSLVVTGESRGMMLLFPKQVHLQKDVGAEVNVSLVDTEWFGEN